jgi:hypothetical protein
MESTISGLADGTLKGPAKWYAQFHVAGCHKCSQALAMFSMLKLRLRTFAGSSATDAESMPVERRSTLDAVLDAMDDDQSKSG